MKFYITYPLTTAIGLNLITYSELPSYFSFTPDDNVFGDDKWRSIVSYSRKVKEAPEPFPECDEDEGDYKFCERCFYRNCTEKSNCNEEM